MWRRKRGPGGGKGAPRMRQAVLSRFFRPSDGSTRASAPEVIPPPESSAAAAAAAAAEAVGGAAAGSDMPASAEASRKRAAADGASPPAKKAKLSFASTVLRSVRGAGDLCGGWAWQEEEKAADAAAKKTEEKSAEGEEEALPVGRRGGRKLTPLESQVAALKQQHGDMLLAVECGYKYRFFGRDALLAARLLGIHAHWDRSFMVASIPVPRLGVHIRRLVDAGHKVGIVRQLETAALKAVSRSKSKLFKRAVAAVYTRGTLVGEEIELSGSEHDYQASSGGVTTAIACLWEAAASEGQQGDEKEEEKEGEEAVPTAKQQQTCIGFVAIDVHAGTVVYDSFADGPLRTGVETRLRHVQPCELPRLPLRSQPRWRSSATTWPTVQQLLATSLRRRSLR
eukprot:PLAT11477.2.p2 GENE.PLAT11477.2~~PLAT11477.2.p2  ORF type:complete len:397 (+),score=174.16 PLAT11477.2:707-1897(+)